MSRILIAAVLAAFALTVVRAADDSSGASKPESESQTPRSPLDSASPLPATSLNSVLPENGTVKVLSLETEPCASESGSCLRVVAQCKLKRRSSNWSKSLVKIVWYDPKGAAGFSASQGFDSCRGEAGDEVAFLFPLPPAGFRYSIELP